MRFLKILFIVVVVIIVVVVTVAKVFKVNPPIISSAADGTLPIDKLILPEGYSASVYASEVVNARSMCFGKDNSILFVGTRGEGNVYALIDSDLNYKSDQQYLLYSNGNMPNGVAYKDGDLYIAEVDRILRFKNIESKLDNPGIPEVIYDDYPTASHHGWKYVAFGPDGRLYIPVGAPCNVCESDDTIFNTITALDIESGEREILHSGIRNTVGFDWHPITNDLWFTDNGRDMMGDNKPECELNHASEPNMHFGFPYCHQGNLPDPKFGKKHSCNEFSPPKALMGPHTAPLGMEFYTGTQFTKEYMNSIFIARHGSWNRSEKIGYDVVNVRLDEEGTVIQKDVFVSGWLSKDKSDVWGRPVDIEQCNDGSILISDDFGDAIYRITYKGT
jgi:glucose/arabinose dehydrogenase